MEICLSFSPVWPLLCMALFYSTFVAFRRVECDSKLTPKPGQRMDTILSFYENIVLNPVDESLLDESSQESKVGGLPIHHLQISALNRTFSLHLHRGESVFTEDAKIVVHGKTTKDLLEMDAADFRTNFVEGYLLEEPWSSVRGHVQDGAFFGTVSYGNVSFYVEPATTYFLNASHLDAIVYRESDVMIKSTWPTSFCYGSNNSQPSDRWTNATPWHWDGGNSKTSYPRPGNGLLGQSAKEGKACKVKVVSDHYFFKAYGGSSLRRTVADMEYHVREADLLFRKTDFDNDGNPDNLRILMSKAEVFESPSASNYLMGDRRLNASAYLELFSMYNHDGFCGAMAFSQRTFEGDVLGFAYRGGPRRLGGICFRQQNVNGKWKSLNVGMTSFDFRGTTVPKARSTVVFAHELGHMFGAPHDEDAEGGSCFQNSVDNHFIMSSIANPGRSASNRMFSRCSTNLMLENMKIHGSCLRTYADDDYRKPERGRGHGSWTGTPTMMGFLVVWLLAFRD